MQKFEDIVDHHEDIEDIELTKHRIANITLNETNFIKYGDKFSKFVKYGSLRDSQLASKIFDKSINDKILLHSGGF